VLDSVQSTVMATRPLRRAATTPPVAGPSILTPPPAIHTPSNSRADRAYGVNRREMEDILTGLRNRHVSAPNLSTTTDYQTSKEADETLTPISRDDREEIQGTISLD